MYSAFSKSVDKKAADKAESGKQMVDDAIEDRLRKLQGISLKRVPADVFKDIQISGSILTDDAINKLLTASGFEELRSGQNANYGIFVELAPPSELYGNNWILRWRSAEYVTDDWKVNNRRRFLQQEFNTFLEKGAEELAKGFVANFPQFRPTEVVFVSCFQLGHVPVKHVINVPYVKKILTNLPPNLAALLPERHQYKFVPVSVPSAMDCVERAKREDVDNEENDAKADYVIAGFFTLPFDDLYAVNISYAIRAVKSKITLNRELEPHPFKEGDAENAAGIVKALAGHMGHNWGALMKELRGD